MEYGYTYWIGYYKESSDLCPVFSGKHFIFITIMI